MHYTGAFSHGTSREATSIIQVMGVAILIVECIIPSLSLSFKDDFSRVKLNDLPTEEGSDYINACSLDVCKTFRSLLRRCVTPLAVCSLLE